MQIVNYLIEAYLSYNNDSIEQYLTVCENTISNVTNDVEIKFKLKSALHELVVNSLEHGYNKSKGKVTFSIKKSNTNIWVEIRDEGSGISDTKLNFDIIHNSLDSTTSRGWGLFILKNLFEKMEFRKNSPSGTIVSMELSLN